MVEAIETADGVEELLDPGRYTSDRIPSASRATFRRSGRRSTDQIRFRADLERTVDAIEDAIRERVPDADRIYVEAETSVR